MLFLLLETIKKIFGAKMDKNYIIRELEKMNDNDEMDFQISDNLWVVVNVYGIYNIFILKGKDCHFINVFSKSNLNEMVDYMFNFVSLPE